VVADGDVKMFMVDADSGEKIKAFGDTVIDTSVRSRLQSLRTLLLDGGTSHGR
jgi:hypothetical protein